MSLMRTYRAALTLSQSAFAARLNVPLETYRTWDSGRREPSKEFLSRARTLAGAPGRHRVVVVAGPRLDDRCACSDAAGRRTLRSVGCCL